MSKTIRQSSIGLWTEDADSPSVQVGYEEALTIDIAKGVEQLDDDKVAEAPEVCTKLGLE